MKAKWRCHTYSTKFKEHVLFVGPWEWRIHDVLRLGGREMVETAFGRNIRWKATGPGLEGGSNVTETGIAVTVTLRQAKGRCEDAALRCLEVAAGDLGMMVVEKAGPRE